MTASASTAALAGLLALGYAVPLLVPLPPAPAAATTLRLLALAGAALLLSRPLAPGDPPRTEPAKRPAAILRLAALGVAVAHAAIAPYATSLSVAGQVAYLACLFVPAVLLTTTRPHPHVTRQWLSRLGPAAFMVVLWVSLRLVVDAHSMRAAHVIDTWRTSLGVTTFLDGPGNYVTDGIDPEMPGIPATPLFVLGLPLVQAGLVPLSFDAIRLMHLLSLAVTAAAVGMAARRLLGSGATVAVAVFLFAPLVRSVALSAGPYAVASTYAVMVVLCATATWRRGSEAALAALGSACGLAIVHPGLAPTAIVGAVIGAASLRGRRSSMPWTVIATAIASFAAAALPHGPAALARTLDLARSALDGHATSTMGEVLLSPFVVARAPGRLWGDTLFDPVGATLLATGLVSCVRSLPRTPAAAILLLFVAAALLPALAANGDHPVLLRSFVLPVPGALLAAAGFQALRQACGERFTFRHGLAVAAAVSATGTVVFDVVNPRILGTSALTLMFRAVDEDSARRTVLVDDASELGPDVRTLDRGPMTAIDGERPIAYLRYGNGSLPDLAASGQDLLFWSPEVERTVQVTDVVCSQWPDATLYRIGDEAHEGTVHAARIGAVPWQPPHEAGAWRANRCARPRHGAG